MKDQFVHFQERRGSYPAHLSALLEIDLLRIARENGLLAAKTYFSGRGRIPRTNTYWPQLLSAFSGWRGRLFSDNVLLVAQRPE